MIIRVDESTDEPLYLQIHNEIVSAIADGQLGPGDGLPSVRSLACDLGVNLHTVNKAYAVLRDEGYVLMRRGSSATVSDQTAHSTQRLAKAQDERMSEALYHLALAYKARGGTYDGFVQEAGVQADAVFGDGQGEAGRLEAAGCTSDDEERHDG